MAVETQVFSEQSVHFGNYATFFWTWPGDNSKVPASKRLNITSLTLSYFPTGGGTVGNADIAGRISGNAVWRLQSVFVEPYRTVHLTFPGGLTLEAGGQVQVGFVTQGPGAMFVSANGKLVDV